MRRYLIPSALGLATALAVAPLAFPEPEQCPCPPKKVQHRAARPKPRPTPTPTPTPTPPPVMPVATDDNTVPIDQNVDPRWMQPIELPPTPIPSPTPKPEGMKATVLAGGLVSFGSGTDGGAMSPLARVGVNGPIPLPGIEASHYPRVIVSADFTALPGDTAQLASLDTFKALEFQVGVAQRVAPEMRSGSQRITASLYGLAGFATRLPGDLEPRDGSPRYGAIGFRLDEWTSGSFLVVALASDQRLDGRYQPAVLITGAVLLKELGSGSLQGGRALLVGSAILGMDYSYAAGTTTPVRRDIVRVGIAVGR